MREIQDKDSNDIITINNDNTNNNLITIMSEITIQ